MHPTDEDNVETLYWGSPPPYTEDGALSLDKTWFGPKERGAWFGLAVGDALGAPYEFKSAARVETIAPARLTMKQSMSWAVGEWTDDTDLTLATSAAYEGGNFDLERAAAAMVTWYRTEPKDIGNLTRQTLGMISRQEATAATAGALALNGNLKSAGNGSLMRCLSTAIVRRASDPRLKIESAALSRITHADERCVDACIAFNTVIAALFEGLEIPRAMLLGYHSTESLQVRAVLERALNGGAPLYSNQDGIGFVLLSFERGMIALRDSTSFEEGLQAVIRMGGDTDTNAAIAGALLGARFGYRAIPKDWRDGLQKQDVLQAALLNAACRKDTP